MMPRDTLLRCDAREPARDGVAGVEIARDHDGMHVRFSAHRGSVAQLSGHHAHRHDDVALRFALTAGRPELRENRREPERSTPRAKILCRVPHAEVLSQVLIHVAGIEVVPRTLSRYRKRRRPGASSRRATNAASSASTTT